MNQSESSRTFEQKRERNTELLDRRIKELTSRFTFLIAELSNGNFSLKSLNMVSSASSEVTSLSKDLGELRSSLGGVDDIALANNLVVLFDMQCRISDLKDQLHVASQYHIRYLITRCQLLELRNTLNLHHDAHDSAKKVVNLVVDNLHRSLNGDSSKGDFARVCGERNLNANETDQRLKKAIAESEKFETLYKIRTKQLKASQQRVSELKNDSQTPVQQIMDRIVESNSTVTPACTSNNVGSDNLETILSPSCDSSCDNVERESKTDLSLKKDCKLRGKILHLMHLLPESMSVFVAASLDAAPSSRYIPLEVFSSHFPTLEKVNVPSRDLCSLQGKVF